MAVALLVAVVGDGAAGATARPGLAGFRAGEAMTFKFSVGPVESGRARMSVGKPTITNGRQLVAVHGQAETAPWLQLLAAKLDDEYRLVLDATSLLPVTVLSVERGIRERRIESQLDGRRAQLEVTSKVNGGKASRLLPTVVRDPLSQLFALRAAPLKDGDRWTQDILDGAALWRLSIVVHRNQRVRLDLDGEDARSRAAIRVDGELHRIEDSGRPTGQPSRHVRVWLSDDALRVLYRLEADTDLGRASVELTSYTPAR
jgi:hypothetical protein